MATKLTITGGKLTLYNSTLLGFDDDIVLKGNPRIYDSLFSGTTGGGEPYISNSNFSGAIQDNARVINSQVGGELQGNATAENMHGNLGLLIGNSYVNNVNMLAGPPDHFIVHTGGYCGWEYLERDEYGNAKAVHVTPYYQNFDEGKSPLYGCLSHL